MIRENFERAKEIERRILSINMTLAFLRKVNDDDKLNVRMTESGILPNPADVLMDRADIPIIIQAYEDEKDRLNREFDRL